MAQKAKHFKTRVQNKHATEAQWHEAINFIPLAGELIIYDIDDTHSSPRFKIGDGIVVWNDEHTEYTITGTKINDLPFTNNIETPDWNQNNKIQPDYIKNRTHYEIPEHDIVDWDGNIEGRHTVETEQNSLLVKISDVPIDMNSLEGARIDIYSYETQELDESYGDIKTEDNTIYDGGYAVEQGAGWDLFVINDADKFNKSNQYSDQFEVGAYIGIYLDNGNPIAYTKRIHKDAEIIKLDSKFLPDTVPHIKPEIEITWDGNIEGRNIVQYHEDMYYIKVSDNVYPLDRLNGSSIEYSRYSDHGVEDMWKGIPDSAFDVWDGGYVLDFNGSDILIVTDANRFNNDYASMVGNYENGIYFKSVTNDTYTSRFVILGEAVKLDSKCMPEPLIVTITRDEQNHEWVSHTPHEILTHINNGGIAWLDLGNDTYTDKVPFTRVDENDAEASWITDELEIVNCRIRSNKQLDTVRHYSTNYEDFDYLRQFIHLTDEDVFINVPIGDSYIGINDADEVSLYSPYGIHANGCVVKDIDTPQEIDDAVNVRFLNSIVDGVYFGSSKEGLPSNEIWLSQGSTLIPNSVKRNVIIPKIYDSCTVTGIMALGFKDYELMQSITLPDTIKCINVDAFVGCSNLTDVYYEGTKTQWESIQILNGNETLTNATIHYNQALATKEYVDNKVVQPDWNQWDSEQPNYIANKTHGVIRMGKEFTASINDYPDDGGSIKISDEILTIADLQDCVITINDQVYTSENYTISEIPDAAVMGVTAISIDVQTSYGTLQPVMIITAIDYSKIPEGMPEAQVLTTGIYFHKTVVSTPESSGGGGGAIHAYYTTKLQLIEKVKKLDEKYLPDMKTINGESIVGEGNIEVIADQASLNFNDTNNGLPSPILSIDNNETKNTIYWDGIVAASLSSTATGTENDPIIINNAEELAYLVNKATDTTDKYYKIADNIESIVLQSAFISNNIKELNNWEDVKSSLTANSDGNIFDSSKRYTWVSNANAFNGHFDGNGVTIYGLYAEGSYCGLFGAVGDGATIKNVIVKNSYLRPSWYAGVIVSNSTDVGLKLENCIIANCAIYATQVVKSIPNQCIGLAVGRTATLQMNNCFIYGCDLSYETDSSTHNYIVGGASNSITKTKSILLDCISNPYHYTKIIDNIVYTDNDIASIEDIKGEKAVTAMPNLAWGIDWFIPDTYTGKATPLEFLQFSQNALLNLIQSNADIVNDKKITSLQTTEKYTFDWNAMYLIKSNSGNEDITLYNSATNAVVIDGDGNNLPASSFCILVMPKESMGVGTNSKLCFFLGQTGEFSMFNPDVFKGLQFTVTSGDVYFTPVASASIFKIAL